jgi:hypothetical protein
MICYNWGKIHCHSEDRSPLGSFDLSADWVSKQRQANIPCLWGRSGCALGCPLLAAWDELSQAGLELDSSGHHSSVDYSGLLVSTHY